MLVQEVAESLSETSHRVRLACQDLEIEISSSDEVELTDTMFISIRDHVYKQRDDYMKEKKERDEAAAKAKGLI